MFSAISYALHLWSHENFFSVKLRVVREVKFSQRLFYQKKVNFLATCDPQAHFLAIFEDSSLYRQNGTGSIEIIYTVASITYYFFSLSTYCICILTIKNGRFYTFSNKAFPVVCFVLISMTQFKILVDRNVNVIHLIVSSIEGL